MFVFYFFFSLLVLVQRTPTSPLAFFRGRLTISWCDRIVLGEIFKLNASSVMQFGYIYESHSRYGIPEFGGGHTEIVRWTRNRIWSAKGLNNSMTSCVRNNSLRPNFWCVVYLFFFRIEKLQEEILAAAKHGERLLDDFRSSEIKEFSERTGNVSSTER